jgi:hypothetical protein
LAAFRNGVGSITDVTTAERQLLAAKMPRRTATAPLCPPPPRWRWPPVRLAGLNNRDWPAIATNFLTHTTIVIALPMAEA